MDIRPLALSGLALVTPRRHGDERGFFSEVWRDDLLAPHGIGGFVQDNHSWSAGRHTVRGLHFQAPPKAQGKLVRCTRGAVIDVAVDLRVGSPTLGRHVAVTLSRENWAMLWVPAGFAHGFCTLEPDTEILYKVTTPYDPALDRGIAFDDPALGIVWPVGRAGAVLSAKDAAWPLLAEIGPVFGTEG